MPICFSVPANEAARLSALRDLLVLDSPPEPLFDLIAKCASEICGTPIALISLTDAERQWFKATVGLQGFNDAPRESAICAHAWRRSPHIEFLWVAGRVGLGAQPW